jgi:hypothetical protein
LRLKIVLASNAAALALLVASDMRVAYSEDGKDLEPATQIKVEAPTQPQTVTPQTQVKGPPAPTASPQVTRPSETRNDPDLQQQALDEKAKAAAQGVVKTRVYPVSGRVILLQGRPALLGESVVTYFCSATADSLGVDVRLRYEWRPTDSPQRVPGGYLVIRSRPTEIRVPVALRAHGGEASTQSRSDADGRLIIPVGLTRGDMCPSGCIDVRLAPPSSASADRFDQSWRRACLEWR